ncbi:hypothetical protein GIB67_038636 [Kingdonia uniflora]|uniref:O-fucosyltransferase family protein n=1 Tax=Kingdonia uniflora TaxID=39325 RepID=A0A7J7NPN7_9MAGN|nr:hypothetical protein GIB67_038636 [Kingdonia uniflora]
MVIPFFPQVGILLRAFGYSSDTIIYVSGGEVFGGQRTMVPLHAMFDNVVNRTSLTTVREITKIYGCEGYVAKTSHRPSPIEEETKLEAWKSSGPCPRPLPPPPVRPKYPYNIEGWWGLVAASDNEPDSTVAELRANAHKLLWEAIDYVICVEAKVFIPAFDRDGRGRSNLSSMVMGHRLYQSAASKTYRPDRKKVAKFFDEIRDHLYQANHTWLTLIRKHLSVTSLDGLNEVGKSSNLLSFLSHPVPEYSCIKHNNLELSSDSSSQSTYSQLKVALGVGYKYPVWIDNIPNSYSSESKGKQDDLEDEDPTSQLFLWNVVSGDVGGAEANNKEMQMEDREEIENGEKLGAKLKLLTYSLWILLGNRGGKSQRGCTMRLTRTRRTNSNQREFE